MVLTSWLPQFLRRWRTPRQAARSSLSLFLDDDAALQHAPSLAVTAFAPKKGAAASTATRGQAAAVAAGAAAAADDVATPRLPLRSASAHDALLAEIWRPSPDAAASSAVPTRRPPPADEARTWPESVLRSYCENGGTVTARVAAADAPWLLDEMVGVGFPSVPLKGLELKGGVVGALRRSLRHQQEEPEIDALATRLLEDDFVVCSLGEAGETLLPLVRREAARAYPFMRPGEITRRGHEEGEEAPSASGGGGGGRAVVVSGRSPSGRARGDRFVLARSLAGGLDGSTSKGWVDAWPALAAADELLGCLGSTAQFVHTRFSTRIPRNHAPTKET